MDFKYIDNKGDNTLLNVMKDQIKSGTKISVASGFFSLFAYEQLMKELKKSNDIRFLFTEELEYLRLIQLNGNHFEFPLRNKMMSKYIAENLKQWIQTSATFKQLHNEHHFPKQFIAHNKDGSSMLIQSELEFTADNLGITKSNRNASFPVMINASELSLKMQEEFDQIWNDQTKVKNVTEQIIRQLDLIAQDNSPEWLYFVTLYHLFTEELEGLSEENIIKEGTNFKESNIWNKLYPFQKDGVIGMINKIEKYNGCILADSVGLGKTMSALAVIKYYELRNDRVLVLCPKKLRDNWLMYKGNDKRNIFEKDRFNYDVLNHTDLSREDGHTGDINLQTLNWSNYDLVVIDESHNFRNNAARKDRLTRYQKLMQDIIKKGVKTKVLLLSATPVNNKMNDIKNQIAFITEENDAALHEAGIESIEKTLRTAQASFNRWTTLAADKRTTQSFIDMVNQDYFELLDVLTIARSRKHIEKYYNVKDIGKFPIRRKPISIKANIDTQNRFMKIAEVNELLESLNFSLYQPMKYVLPANQSYYEQLYDTSVKGGQTIFKQTDREFAVAALMRVNLFKRLESSVHSFKLTLQKLTQRITETLAILQKQQQSNFENHFDEIADFEDEELEASTVGSDKVKIKLQDIDARKWSGDLKADLHSLQNLLSQVECISPAEDAKLQELQAIIQQKIANPINEHNKKIIIFSAYADTVRYLYDQLAEQLHAQGLPTAMVVGSGHNKTTLKGVRAKDIQDILMNFSPRSKERAKISPSMQDEIEILFATDCISEGQNLQDCDCLINYDIHWNPVRVIQRFGRIDRIGSTNNEIQLINFWPNIDLDEYINLEERVKGRMKILNTSASGEEDVFENNKEMNDLEYRRNQLKALQNEVLDLEDVSGAISITDLTYTDFRSDLSNALKKYKHVLNVAPKGIFSIVSNKALQEAVPGVIFCFKQHGETKLQQNSLNPYVLLYITKNGESFINYTHPKQILDMYRKLALGNAEPVQQLVAQFNQATNDAKNMESYQQLLKKAISIIQDRSEESMFDSFFTTTTTTIQTNLQFEVNDMELITFLMIEGEENG